MNTHGSPIQNFEAMATEITRCPNSKRSTDSTGITDQAKARLSPSPTLGKEFFRFPQRQRRKSSEKDEISERSFQSGCETNASGSCENSPNQGQKQRKGSSDEKTGKTISKCLRRAFSVHQESDFDEQTKSSPKLRAIPKTSEKNEQPKAYKKEEFKESMVKFGHVQLPNPNSGGFFKQRASFHSDTANSANSAPTPSTSGLGQQDTGIICSNSDLRSILSDKTTSRRQIADAKRERMKNYRSLSFDSSVFRIPRRASSSDPPVWFSWNKSPNSRAPDPGNESKQIKEEDRRSIVQIRFTSESPEDDMLETAEASGELDIPIPEKVHVVVEADCKAENTDIPWDERSVVDVNVLGNAIESYLGERRASGDETSKPNDDTSIQESSVCSSLRSLFVK